MNEEALAHIASLVRERKVALARESLVDYSLFLWPDEPPALHHRLIFDALKDAFEFKVPLTLIMAPPGSAKSSVSSIRGPSFARGKYPKIDMIAASFTQELADKFGRRVRNTCQSEEWEEIFGTAVSQDSSAVNRWSTSEGGEYFGIGVGGNVVGRRAALAILDDCSGGIKDAVGSKTTREAVWDWYQGDLLPRLKPNASIVVIGTRFHSEDLLGRLIQEHENGVQKARIINLPMIAESNDQIGRKPGELLWPEYFNMDMVARARRNNDTWMALYQQKPIVESGQYFKREWIVEYDKAPDNLKIYGISDYAVTMGGGDFTVHLVVGITEDSRIFLLDLWRGQESTDVWVDELIRLIKKWKPLEWFEEKGQITKGVGPFIDKALREKEIYQYRTQYAMPRGADGLNSKQVGAQSIRGRMAQKMVYFPRGVHWMPDALSEMMAFPTEKQGIHDDFVDCLSLLGRALDRMQEADVIVKPEPINLLAQPTFKEIFWDMSEERKRKRL